VTCFVVWNNVSTPGASPWILDGPTPILAIQQVDASNCRGATYFSGAKFTGNKAQATGGAYHISTLHFDGALTNLYYGCDDTRLASMASGAVAGTFDLAGGGQTIYVGQSWGVALVGDIAELIFYDRALTESERMSVELYLAGKYAIQVPYGGGSFMIIQ